MIRRIEEIVDTTRYPAGEPHVRIKKGVVDWVDDMILFNCRDFNDLGLLRTFADMCTPDQQFIVPYMPFGRHDRRRDDGDGYPLNTVRRLLDGLDIITIDPHSPATEWLPRVIPQRSVVLDFLDHGCFNGIDMVVVPDYGAMKKAETWLDDVGLTHMVVEKHRDPEDGSLSFKMPLWDVSDMDLVIVDDICDGGGTFTEIARRLKLRGAHSVGLLVTHGLFTKGTPLPHIDWYRTTDAIPGELCAGAFLRSIINRD